MQVGACFVKQAHTWKGGVPQNAVWRRLGVQVGAESPESAPIWPRLRGRVCLGSRTDSPSFLYATASRRPPVQQEAVFSTARARGTRRGPGVGKGRRGAHIHELRGSFSQHNTRACATAGQVSKQFHQVHGHEFFRLDPTVTDNE